MVKETRPIYILSTGELPQNGKYTQAKSKGMEKDISLKWKRQKAGLTMLVSDKIDFKTKVIVRDLKEHYKMIMGTIHLHPTHAHLNI